jgi:hypothetical protein
VAEDIRTRVESVLLTSGTFTRRETLLGLALGTATSLPSATAAETEQFLRVEKVPDLSHKSKFGLDISFRGLTWALRFGAFGPESRLTGFRTRGGGALTGVTIEIGNASFLSPESRHTLIFDLARVDEKAWNLTMRPGAWLEGHANTASVPVDLTKFLDDVATPASCGSPDAAGPVGPTFQLTVAQAQKVRERLFGDRLQVLKPLVASFRKDGSWTFSALPRIGGGTAGTCEPGSIVVLKSAGFINRLRVRIVEAETGPGASLPEFRGKSGAKRGRDFALVGTAEFTASSSDLVVGEGEASRLVLRPKPLVLDDHEQAMRFALRHDGDPKRTVAMLRAAFDATLTPAAGVALPTFVISLADGLVTRQHEPAAEADLSNEERIKPRADAGIRHRLRGVVQEADRAVQTPYGIFGITGDPIERRRSASSAPSPVSQAAGRDPDLVDFAESLAQSGTMARVETVSDGFTAFEVRALVKSYHLALGDGGDVWSRLDFEGTETAFVLGSLVRRVGGELPLNAAGIVEIGSPPPDLQAWFADEVGPRRAPVEIVLDGARLKVRRASDLLALDFHFVRLALQVRPGHARIVAATRRAVGGAGTAARNQPRPKETDEKTERRSNEPALAYDSRAKLIVTFPPQHVAERAYLRQVNDGIMLPDEPTELPSRQELLQWRSLGVDERLEKRTAAAEKFKRLRTSRASVPSAPSTSAGAVRDETPKDVGGLIEFLAELDGGTAEVWTEKLGEWAAGTLRPKWQKLPRDQRIYLGPDPVLIDPDARGVILAILRARVAHHRQKGVAQAYDGNVRLVPEAMLEPAVIQRVLASASAAAGRSIVAEDAEGRAALLQEKERVDPAFRRARLRHETILSVAAGIAADDTDPEAKTVRAEVARVLGTPNAPSPDFGGGKAPWAELSPLLVGTRPISEIARFGGRESYEEFWQVHTTTESLRRALETLVAFQAQLETAALDENERFALPTSARLSGPSRLVFHVDGGYPPPLNDPRRADFAGDRDQDFEPWPVDIPYTLEALTNWGRFDLAVTRRAERLYSEDGGRLRRASLRNVEGRGEAILSFQGIRPGRSIKGRLEDLARAAALGPAADETAIELPFRLLLSPSQEGRFRTPHAVPDGVFDGKAPQAAFMQRVVGLWSAVLDPSVNQPEVRAVASPDFMPDWFVSSRRIPMRGPWAPWALARAGEGDGQEPARFRTTLDAFDRHELVGLSSVHGMPVLGRFDAEGYLNDPSQFAAPASYRLRGLSRHEAIGDQSAIYRPQPLGVTELRLTAIGGSLVLTTDFVPPIGAIGADGNPVFPGFTIEKWRNRTLLGRDIEVEVVYKGFLYPLGVRASLTKLTERRFVRFPDPADPRRLLYVAYLIQRFYIAVKDSPKGFPALGQANRGRAFPARSLTMLTLQTPDILDPDMDVSKAPPGAGVRIGPAQAAGALHAYRDGSRLQGRIFWPRTAPSPDGAVDFEYQIDGQPGAVRMPLLFIDNVAAANREILEALEDYYNGTDSRTERETRSAREVSLDRTPRRYAEELVAGDCTHETHTWDVRVQGRPGARLDGTNTGGLQNQFYGWDALLQADDQPPFYPRVERALIRVGSAERFVGHPLPAVWVKFTKEYIETGFDRGGTKPRLTPEERRERWAHDSYLVMDPKKEGDVSALDLNMGESGDRGGGIGRPATKGEVICRQVGLVSMSAWNEANKIANGSAGVRSNAAGNAVTPAAGGDETNIVKDFFETDAKFLGLIKFKDLIRLAADNVPELKEATETATEEVSAALKEQVIPRVEAAVAGIDQAWAAASRQVQDTNRGAAALDLEKVYPDIGPALADLRAKLARARAAEGLDLVAALNETAESARRFIQAVERTAADPIAPVKDAVRTEFRNLSHGIESQARSITTNIASEIEALRNGFWNELRERVARTLREADGSAFRALLIALPIPAGLEALDEEVRRDVAALLDMALVEGLQTFVGQVLDGKEIDDRKIQEALSELQQTVEDAVAREAASASGAARTALEAYRHQLRGDAQRLKGVLFDRVFGRDGWLGKLADAQAALAKLAATSPRDLLETVGGRSEELMRALLDATVAQVIAAGIGATVFCDSLASQLHALAQDATLDPTKVRDAAVAYVEAVAPGGSAMFRSEVDAVATRYDAVAQVLRGATDSLREVCAGIADLPAAAIMQAIVAKGELLDAVGMAVRFTPTGTPDLKKQADALKALAEESKALTVAVFPPSNELRGKLIDVGVAQLRKVMPNAPEPELRALFEGGDPVPALVQGIRTRLAEYEGAVAAVQASVTELTAAFTAAALDVTEATVTAQLQKLRKVLEINSEGVQKAALARLRDGERLLMALAGEAIVSASKAANVLQQEIIRGCTVLFVPLADVYDELVAWRRNAYETLGKIDSDTGQNPFRQIIAAILKESKGNLQSALLVKGSTIDNDGLAAEAAAVARLSKVTNIEGLLADVEIVAAAWRSGEPAVVTISRNITTLFAAVLRGDLAAIVDLQDIRRQMESAIRDMVPRRIARSYVLDAPIAPGPALGGLIEVEPEGFKGKLPPALRLTATGSIDLGGNSQRASFAARGSFPAFQLKLLPAFDVVKLTFAESTFEAGDGKPFSLSLRVVDVKLGEQVKFLEDLQAYLSAPKDGSGFFLRLTTDRGRPGIIAGYGIAMPPISVGNMYISNVSLSCAAELPFDDGDARFLISCGRADAPLLISAAPYAGAGYFGLIANPAGIVGFEASFEFGGGGGFSFGPLKGEGRVTVGVFVRQLEGHTTLYGIFFAGGAARLACFSLSASLLVRMSQKDGDLVGEAIFTYSFSIGITDFNFAVRVHKEEKGSSKNNKDKAESEQGSIDRSRYAGLLLDFDVTGSTQTTDQPTEARLASIAVCKLESWKTHKGYFDLQVEGEFLL